MIKEFLINIKLWILYIARVIYMFFNNLFVNKEVLYLALAIVGIILLLGIIIIIYSIKMKNHKKRLQYASESSTRDKPVITAQVKGDTEEEEESKKDKTTPEEEISKTEVIEVKEASIVKESPEDEKKEAVGTDKKIETEEKKVPSLEVKPKAEKIEKPAVGKPDEKVIPVSDNIKNRFVQQVKSDMEAEFIGLINRYFPDKINFKEKFAIKEEIINKCSGILEKLNTLNQDTSVKFSQKYHQSKSIFYYVTGQDGLFEQSIKKEIQLSPDDETPYVYAAAFHLFRKDSSDQAEQYLDKAKAINSSNFDIYFLLVEVHIKNKNFDKATDILKKVILLDSANSTAYAYKGYILTLQGYISDGEKELQKAIEMDYKNYIPYYFLGDIYKNLQFHEKAAGFYEKALQFDCGYLELKENYAFCLIETKKYKGVIKLLQPYEDTNILSTYGSKFLATAYIKKQNYKKAEELLVKAYKKIKNKEEAADLEMRIGDLYYHHLKNYQEAEKYYSRALEKDSENFQVTHNLEHIDYQQSKIKLHNNLGVIYAQSKNYEEAVREFERVLEIDNNNEQAIFNMQKANELLSKKEDQ